jgi:very-short-patch-repair endonuclease
LAIEIDGNSHDHSEVQVNDVLRQETLEKLGVSFIRFNDKDIKKNMNQVIYVLQIKIEELQGLE